MAPQTSPDSDDEKDVEKDSVAGLEAEDTRPPFLEGRYRQKWYVHAHRFGRYICLA